MSHVVTAGFVADEDGPRIRNPAPLLGADTRAVLLEAGVDMAEIDAVVAEGQH